MTFNELTVSAEEQKITLSDGYSAEVLFDPFYYRWYYNLYNNDTLVAAGIALVPDSSGLLHILPISVGCLDIVGNKEDYEPYQELGGRLMLVECLDEDK